jgi:thioredoxin 1
MNEKYFESGKISIFVNKSATRIVIYPFKSNVMKTFITLSCFILVTLFACKKENNDAANSQLTTINNLTEFENRTKSGASLVFFHATWCPKCAEQRPQVEALLGDTALKNVFFAQVDFEKNADIVSKYNVFGFPTILILKDGVVKHSLAGSSNKKEKLKELLEGL